MRAEIAKFFLKRFDKPFLVDSLMTDMAVKVTIGAFGRAKRANVDKRQTGIF